LAAEHVKLGIRQRKTNRENGGRKRQRTAALLRDLQLATAALLIGSFNEI
jgi:hypothetical protein